MPAVPAEKVGDHFVAGGTVTAGRTLSLRGADVFVPRWRRGKPAGTAQKAWLAVLRWDGALAAIADAGAAGSRTAGCGRRIAVKRRHYWMGIPKLHGDCRHKGMVAKRAAVTGDKYVNGTELAERLGIRRSALNRWVEAGKLPKPRRGISGMLLFEREAVASARRPAQAARNH